MKLLILIFAFTFFLEWSAGGSVLPESLVIKSHYLPGQTEVINPIPPLHEESKTLYRDKKSPSYCPCQSADDVISEASFLRPIQAGHPQYRFAAEAPSIPRFNIPKIVISPPSLRSAYPIYQQYPRPSLPYASSPAQVRPHVLPLASSGAGLPFQMRCSPLLTEDNFYQQPQFSHSIPQYQPYAYQRSLAPEAEPKSSASELHEVTDSINAKSSVPKDAVTASSAETLTDSKASLSGDAVSTRAPESTPMSTIKTPIVPTELPNAKDFEKNSLGSSAKSADADPVSKTPISEVKSVTNDKKDEVPRNSEIKTTLDHSPSAPCIIHKDNH